MECVWLSWQKQQTKNWIKMGWMGLQVLKCKGRWNGNKFWFFKVLFINLGVLEGSFKPEFTKVAIRESANICGLIKNLQTFGVSANYLRTTRKPQKFTKAGFWV